MKVKILWSIPNIHWFLHPLAPLLSPSPDSSNWGDRCKASRGTTQKALHLGIPIPVIPCHETPVWLPCPAPFLRMTSMLECKGEGKALSCPCPQLPLQSQLLNQLWDQVPEADLHSLSHCI